MLKKIPFKLSFTVISEQFTILKYIKPAPSEHEFTVNNSFLLPNFPDSKSTICRERELCSQVVLKILSTLADGALLLIWFLCRYILSWPLFKWTKEYLRSNFDYLKDEIQPKPLSRILFTSVISNLN